jgi:fatty-acyl-CoA synthase
MGRAYVLDRLIGDERPSFATAAEVERFEVTPYDERIAAQSTYDALRLGAAVNPDAPAILFLPNADPNETPVCVSHRQFIARVTQVANMFHELGVGADDVVSFLLPLLPESLMTLFGAEAAGIANPINPLLEPSQIAEILRAANTKVLVALGPIPGTQIWEKVARIKDGLPNLKAILVVHGKRDEINSVYSFNDLADREPADRLKSGRMIGAQDTSAFFHTGGTTGMPKLVRHSHRNQVYQAWLMALLFPSKTLLFGLPLFHVAGALSQGLAMLAAGNTIVVLSPSGWRNPNAVSNIWRLVERYKPEVFGGVPTVMAAALQVPIDGAEVSSLQVCVAGGSAIPVAVGRAYQELLKVPVLEVFGMTEMASACLISYPEREVRLGSVGHAAPYSRVRVVQLDADGKYQRDCSVNAIGVLAVSGPGAFSGYLSESHNRGAFIEPGWVNSGDLARLDEKGYVWLTGRAKDLIIRGGHNIDPIVIEEILFQHPAVALAAVVGEPDAYAGELPVAFVQLKPGLRIEAAELIAFISERTPEKAATPVRLYLIDMIPLTGVGKVFKPALRLDAAQRRVTQLLSDVREPGVDISVTTGSHDRLGSLITVTVCGAQESARLEIENQVHARLNPLPMRHEIAWE